MSDTKLRTLGVNVPGYMKMKGYSKTRQKQLLAEANEMAERRNTIIFLDYVMVVDGTIRENQMGNRFVEQTRRMLRRQRGVGLPAGRVKDTVEPTVRGRRKRRNVTEHQP